MMDEETFKEIRRRMMEEDRLYDNYIRYYKERDFVKAGELLWGAINNLAYALGLIYGKKLSGHREIFRFLRELAEVNEREEYRRYVRSVEALHANFYHGWMSEEGFEEYVREAEELRRWLTELLEKHLGPSL